MSNPVGFWVLPGREALPPRLKGRPPGRSENPGWFMGSEDQVPTSSVYSA